MSREIKFRAWNGKQMFNVERINFSGLSVIVDQGQSFNSIGDCYAFDEIELMQFTGLYDKNGKKIYEGDILAVVNPDGDEDAKCIVEWDETGCCYPYEPHNGYGDFDVTSIGWAMTMEYKFEVIGNIYEDASNTQA